VNRITVFALPLVVELDKAQKALLQLLLKQQFFGGFDEKAFSRALANIRKHAPITPGQKIKQQRLKLRKTRK